MGYLEKKIGFCTDAGVRGENEDAVICLSHPKGEKRPEIVVGVADGMGGYSGGAVASSFIVNKLEEYFKEDGYLKLAEELKTQPNNHSYLFKMALENVNQSLYQKRMEDPANGEMGATFCGILGYEMELYLGHAGDCRAYRARQGKLSALTEDHLIGTRIQREKKKKGSSSQQSDLPCYYGLLYRSFGYKPWIKIDFQILKAEPNDFYLLCSDGLYKWIDDKEIQKILLNAEYDPQKCSEKLVETAKKNGSNDNISAACLLYLNFMGLEMSMSEPTARLKL